MAMVVWRYYVTVKSNPNDADAVHNILSNFVASQCFVAADDLGGLPEMGDVNIHRHRPGLREAK